MTTQQYDPQSEQIIQMLTPTIEVKPSAELRDRIIQAAQHANTKTRQTRLSYWIGACASMAAVAVVAVILTTSTPAYAARQYFSNAILAVKELKTMVMELQVRTMPDEPIDYINASCDFIPASIKVIYGEPMLWCAKKDGGRTVLYKGPDANGNKIYQWIDNNQIRIGWMGNYKEPISNDLAAFLDPRILLDLEYNIATRGKNTDYEIIENNSVITIKVTTTAQGDYSESNYLLNTSIAESNSIREYRFDKYTGELLKMRIDIMVDNTPITVIESNNISFNEPLSVDQLSDVDLHTITFSDNEIEPDHSSPLANISVDEAAKIIINAMSCWDTTILNTAMHYYKSVMNQLEPKFKDLKVTSIGKAFKSGLYAGYFVKCNVILNTGEEEELVIALRNDNKNGIWLLDGGL